jgi:hypothetical protein
MTVAPWFQSSIPTPEMLDAWAAGERAIFAATQDDADTRDRGLEMAMRGRQRRQPERMESEG